MGKSCEIAEGTLSGISLGTGISVALDGRAENEKRHASQIHIIKDNLGLFKSGRSRATIKDWTTSVNLNSQLRSIIYISVRYAELIQCNQRPGAFISNMYLDTA